MSIKIGSKDVADLQPVIVVFGVGGAGCNAVDNMISSNTEGVTFWVANTDAQCLKNSKAANKIQLGAEITKGLGAGSNPEVGSAAANESIESIKEVVEGCNMVFITAGMGGGTGTGASPVIAKAIKEKDSNILTVAVVTKPFHFEGARRMKIAELGLEELSKYVDTLIVIHNQNLFKIANEKTTLADAFKRADSVLESGVMGITDLITKPGVINLDFADLYYVMSQMGSAMMGTGEAEGERRALDAAEAAIYNPLLDQSSMKGARGVLINITGSKNMTLFEVDEAANRVKEEVDENAIIILGSAFDDSLGDKIRVYIVATGLDPVDSRKKFTNMHSDSVTTMNIVDNSVFSGDFRRGHGYSHGSMQFQQNYGPKKVSQSPYEMYGNEAGNHKIGSKSDVSHEKKGDDVFSSIRKSKEEIVSQRYESISASSKSGWAGAYDGQKDGGIAQTRGLYNLGASESFSYIKGNAEETIEHTNYPENQDFSNDSESLEHKVSQKQDDEAVESRNLFTKSLKIKDEKIPQSDHEYLDIPAFLRKKKP